MRSAEGWGNAPITSITTGINRPLTRLQNSRKHPLEHPRKETGLKSVRREPAAVQAARLNGVEEGTSTRQGTVLLPALPGTLLYSLSPIPILHPLLLLLLLHLPHHLALFHVSPRKSPRKPSTPSLADLGRTSTSAATPKTYIHQVHYQHSTTASLRLPAALQASGTRFKLIAGGLECPSLIG